MRTNDKVLLENINDYFSHKGMSPNLIDDIKEKFAQILRNPKNKTKIILNIEASHQRKLYLRYNVIYLHYNLIQLSFYY